METHYLRLLKESLKKKKKKKKKQGCTGFESLSSAVKLAHLI